MWRNDSHHYGYVAQGLHWSVALLMLARVAGKSPVECLTDAYVRGCVRRTAFKLVFKRPSSMEAALEEVGSDLVDA